MIHLEGPVDQLAALVRELLAGRMPNHPATGTDAAGSVTTPALPWDQVVAAWRDWATARGMAVKSIAAYQRMLELGCEFSGWRTVADAKVAHVSAWLAARARNEHKGRPWSDNTIRQAVHAFRSLGAWLECQDLPNPFAKLDGPKKLPGAKKAPITYDQARELLRVSLERGHKDGRANPDAAMFWALLMYTGLRYGEGFNLNWSDVLLDAEVPHIRMTKGKARRTDLLPLHPRMIALLRAHRASGTGKGRVFAHPPTKPAFEVDRMAAKIPKRDGNGNSVSIHSLRCSFITWLGRFPQVPEGLRKMLGRHADDLTEGRYTTRELSELAAAVGLLPDLWPVQSPNPPPDGVRGSESYPQSEFKTCNPPADTVSCVSDLPQMDIHGIRWAVESGRRVAPMTESPPAVNDRDGPVGLSSLPPACAPDHVEINVVRALTRWLELQTDRASRMGATHESEVRPVPRFPPHI